VWFNRRILRIPWKALQTNVSVLQRMGKESKLLCCIEQRGPTTSDLRAILQKRVNSWATSNQMVYETIDSNDLKWKRKNGLVSASFKLLHNSN